MHFDVRPMTDEDRPNVLAVLNEAFDRQSSWAWFEWKHSQGPWGPSLGWVAVTSDGRIAGARLFLPWSVWGPDGTTMVPIARAVDGAVAPWAQRRGLFSRCVGAEMEVMAAGQRRAQLVYSTSVPGSREAYRKLGWAIWEEPHRVTPVLPSLTPAKLVWNDALDSELPSTGTAGTTAWHASALRWRTNEASGREYRTARLRAATGPNGLILRKTSLKGVPTLVVIHAWGTEVEKEKLIAAAASRIGCLAVLTVGRPQLRRPSITRGASTISAWGPETEGRLPGDLQHRLTFDLADLEGTM